jgi:hypothetical protein
MQIFAWLALHDRVLTVDNMIKRHGECNQLCSLCLCMNETTEHLMWQHNFTEAYWNTITQQFHLINYDQIP